MSSYTDCVDSKMISEYEKIKERETLVELVRIYKNFPSLWDRSHKHFHNTPERQKTYKIFLEEYKKFDKTATIEDVRKRLLSIKSSFKREKDNVQSLVQSVGHCDNYEPTLWYYPYLNFLYKFEGEPRAPSPDYFYYRKARQEMEAEMKKKGIFPEDSPLERDHAKMAALNKHSAEALGKALGYQLKGLTNLQRCVAEKLIQDILFHAKTEQLTLGSTLHLDYRS